MERWAGEGGVGVRAALGVRGAKNEREDDSPLYASLLHHANPEVIVNTWNLQSNKVSDFKKIYVYLKKSDFILHGAAFKEDGGGGGGE